MVPPAGEANLPGPRIALAFPPLAEEDLEAALSATQDDHHGGRGLRLQLRLRQLEREQELPQPLDGGFSQRNVRMSLPIFWGSPMPPAGARPHGSRVKPA